MANSATQYALLLSSIHTIQRTRLNPFRYLLNLFSVPWCQIIIFSQYQQCYHNLCLTFSSSTSKTHPFCQDRGVCLNPVRVFAFFPLFLFQLLCTYKNRFLLLTYLRFCPHRFCFYHCNANVSLFPQCSHFSECFLQISHLCFCKVVQLLIIISARVFLFYLQFHLCGKMSLRAVNVDFPRLLMFVYVAYNNIVIGVHMSTCYTDRYRNRLP